MHVDEPSKPITPIGKQLSLSTPQAANILTPESTGDNCSAPSADQVCRTVVFLNTAIRYRRDRGANVKIKRTRLHNHFCRLDQPSTTSSSVEQPSLPTQQAATVLRPKSTGDTDRTSLFEAQSLLTERQQKMVVQAVSHKDATVLAGILTDHCPSGFFYYYYLFIYLFIYFTTTLLTKRKKYIQ